MDFSDGSTLGAKMATFIRRFLVAEDGPTAVEYAVMLALIVGACLASVNLLAHATGDSFDDTSAQLAGVLAS
jgi:pilus assembly protein Flp/PilA